MIIEFRINNQIEKGELKMNKHILKDNRILASAMNMQHRNLRVKVDIFEDNIRSSSE